MALAALVCIVGVIWLAAFLAAYVHYLNKAKKRQRDYNEPVSHSKITKEALAIACIVGCVTLIECCKEEAAADRQADVEAQQSQPGGNTMQMQMPMAQPQIWPSVQSAAEDQVQG